MKRMHRVTMPREAGNAVFRLPTNILTESRLVASKPYIRRNTMFSRVRASRSAFPRSLRFGWTRGTAPWAVGPRPSDWPSRWSLDAHSELSVTQWSKGAWKLGPDVEGRSRPVG
jgi:hypothetical protein